MKDVPHFAYIEKRYIHTLIIREDNSNGARFQPSIFYDIWFKKLL